MDWCERCGRYFIRRTGQPITHGIAGRGVVREPATSVCDSCMRWDEWVDETGKINSGPRPTKDQVADGEPRPLR